MYMYITLLLKLGGGGDSCDDKLTGIVDEAKVRENVNLAIDVHVSRLVECLHLWVDSTVEFCLWTSAMLAITASSGHTTKCILS